MAKKLSVDDYDSIPYFRGSTAREKEAGHFLSQSKKYATKYSKPGGDKLPQSNVTEYRIPKKGQVDFSKDKKLRKEFADFLASKSWSKVKKHPPFYATTLKKWQEYQFMSADTLFPNGHPHYRYELDVVRFLNKKNKGWQTVQFWEGDADVGDRKGNISVRTNGRGVAKSPLVLEDSAPLKKAVAVTTVSANTTLYQGKTFKQHISKAFPGQSKKVLSSLNASVKSGESIAQATRNLKNTLGRSSRDVRTITRSYIMNNAAQAKKTVYALNPALTEVIVWTATLDARTTPNICGVRDGQKYNEQTLEPIGHGNPWDGGPGAIHWNCRSTSYPDIPGVSGKMNRPEIGSGPNYKAGDNKNSRGKVRKNTKKLREDGIIKTGQVSGAKYSTWLKKQNAAFQDDVLGKAKGAAFRKGQFQLGGKL